MGEKKNPSVNLYFTQRSNAPRAMCFMDAVRIFDIITRVWEVEAKIRKGPPPSLVGLKLATVLEALQYIATVRGAGHVVPYGELPGLYARAVIARQNQP